MTAVPKILTLFAQWANAKEIPTAFNVNVGIEDQEMEDVAWLRFDTPNTVSSIKIWSSGYYYIEILTIQHEDPLLAEFGECGPQLDFSVEFARLFDRIAAYESSISESQN